jgi:hypothetical protein
LKLQENRSTHPYFDKFIQIKQVREFLNLIFEYNYALVGGLAVSFWVPERKPTPGELDILLDEDHINDFIFVLESQNYTIEGWKGIDLTNVVVRKEKFRFDILLAQDDWLKEMLYFSIKIKAKKIKVLHPKWLIKMKLLAMREKDLKDVEMLEYFLKKRKL